MENPKKIDPSQVEIVGQAPDSNPFGGSDAQRGGRGPSGLNIPRGVQVKQLPSFFILPFLIPFFFLLAVFALFAAVFIGKRAFSKIFVFKK